MKNFVAIIFVLCFILQDFTAQSQVDTIFDKANKAYMQKDYPTAIHLYTDIISAGNVSADVYYNLGNAYFKNSQLSQAILWYERALRIDPSNEDIIYNIVFANSRITDEMETMPDFFLKRWFKSMYSSLSSMAWAVTSLVLCVCLFIFLVVLLLSASAKRRIFLFFASVLLFLLLAMSITFAYLQHKQSLRDDEAIIMRMSVAVKSMPDKAGTDLFTVHEGLKVRLLDKVGNWIEVVFPNGHKGWIEETAVEII
ncbi:MAG: tetratricopeptide repeat protein [Bacteroidales bacterium]|jgi:tetratricopeptide (TPR) repeat protein|nr:tetratricopeptide repeat protein [Bacteroidales bacterium]